MLTDFYPISGAQCVDHGTSYLCQCLEGFVGKNCDDSINMCSSYPCQNGGTCQDGMDDYTCTCPPGYVGKNCSLPVSWCEHNPCHNGATCHERDGRYVCACFQGYGGKNCQFLLPEHSGSQPDVKAPGKRYSEAGELPWTAVCAGIILVLLLLLGGAVLAVYLRVKGQRQGQLADGHSESETMNNLTHNRHHEKDLSVSVVSSTQIKNTNKKVDFRCDNGSTERNSYKARNPAMDYNLVYELKHEELPMVSGNHGRGDCELQEKHCKRLKR